jgi:VWFA-related protein
VRPVDSAEASRRDFDLFLMSSRDPRTTDLQSPSGPASRLDLKIPTKARREYERGYQLLLLKDLDGAIRHFTKSLAICPKFVAAHNALGTAYLELGQNELGKNEFSKAIALDNHLPNSYLNLGCAHLVLKEYPEAEESLRTATTIAPLDVQLQLALAYAEYLNKDYPAVLATTRQLHEKEHDGAAKVHYYAAAAWEAQGNLSGAQHEMELLLKEDPLSDDSEQYRQVLQKIEAEEARRAEAKLHPVSQPDPDAAERRRQFALQQDKEAGQIAEAEAAPNPACMDCDTAVPVSFPNSVADSVPSRTGHGGSRANFRVSVNEVSVVFAATHHGKSVTDLAPSDVEIRDDGQPPSAILGFRNESQLPLRLGLVVDMSDSVNSRFAFEQEAAARFLQRVVGNKDDLAFVVGFSNSILLVQDFTSDHALISHGVNELAPKGGTALWDAVAFAADKLASHPEVEPVARILVVISDGDDNSSKVTLKQAVASAQRGEVAVYTVNSRDGANQDPRAVGDHALKTLSELTGGTAYKPGSIDRLSRSLADLQEVIRGRYLVSYKPASFQRDDRYRSIDIAAQKDGRKLTVFARKGYYASAEASR